MTSLLNQSRTKTYSLALAHVTGRKQFTRVSREFIERVEARLKAVIREEIHRAPGRKTL